MSFLLARLEASATVIRRVGARIVDAGIDAASVLLEHSSFHDWDTPHTPKPILIDDVRVKDLAAVLLEHPSVTVPTAFADVVVACACDPAVPMTSTEWAAHVIRELAQISAAPYPSAAVAEERRAPTTPQGVRPTLHSAPAVAAGVRPAPDEEAGAGRSSWFQPST